MASLFTLEEFLVELGSAQGADVNVESWVAQSEPKVRALIEAKTGRNFSDLVETTWIRSGSGRYRLVLPDTFSIETLVSVEYRNGAVWTEMADPELFMIDGFVLTSLSIPFPAGCDNIRVVCETGYDDTEDVPEIVRTVALSVALQLWATGPRAMSEEAAGLFNPISKAMRTSLLDLIPRSTPGV